MGTIDELVGTPGRAGPISKETIATALGVSESTVSRWARGDAVPDDVVYRRLRWLRSQRRTWYLRFCDFALLVWTPLRRGETDEATDLDEDEDEDDDAPPYFSAVTFRPTKHPSIVECELTLAQAFQSIAFIVLGPRRHEVELALTPKGQGGRTVRFDRRLAPAPRQKPPSLARDSAVRFYLRYLV